jgi:hypothetical protein
LGTTGLSLSPWSELTSFENERFCSLVCSTSLRFLHLPRKVASTPMTITAMANGMKIHDDQPVAVAAGVGAAAAGVLTGSEDELAVTGGAVVAAAGVLTGSQDELAVTGRLVVVAAACVATGLPRLVAGRVG